MTSLTFQIDDSMVAQLDEIASARQLPRDELMNEVVASYLDFAADQIAKVKAGIAAADRGEFAGASDFDAIEAELEAKIRERP